jgi:hypothetical protein
MKDIHITQASVVSGDTAGIRGFSTDAYVSKDFCIETSALRHGWLEKSDFMCMMVTSLHLEESDFRILPFSSCVPIHSPILFPVSLIPGLFGGLVRKFSFVDEERGKTKLSGSKQQQSSSFSPLLYFSSSREVPGDTVSESEPFAKTTINGTM